MYVPLLVGQVVTVIAMAAVSYWGWRNIDPETRIRARVISHDWTMRSKTTALLWSPVIGLLVLLGTLAVGESPSRDTGAALGLAVLVIFLLAHWSSVKRAAR